MMMEAAAGKGLNASDYPTLNFPYEWRTSAVGGESPVETAGRTKTLRVGPSLASMQCDRVMGSNGASGGEGRGAVGADAVPFQGCGGEEENHPELGGGGGTILLFASPRCIVLFALGGVTCSEALGLRGVQEVRPWGDNWAASLLRPEVRVCRDLAPHGSATHGPDTHRNASGEEEWDAHKHTRLRVSVGIVCASSCPLFFSMGCFIRCMCVHFSGHAARLLSFYFSCVRLRAISMQLRRRI
ncbi:hypothetical protein MOQ_007986, partial [Trypanosoma cruzi marinkellei]